MVVRKVSKIPSRNLEDGVEAMDDRKTETGCQKNLEFDPDWFDFLFITPGHVPNPRGVDDFPDGDDENEGKSETERVEVGKRKEKQHPSPLPLSERIIVRRIPARVNVPWDDDRFLDAIADAVASAVLDEAVQLREEAEARRGTVKAGNKSEG